MDREKRLALLSSIRKNMLTHLDINFIDASEGKLVATMPVDHRTQQPFGLLHGGASVTLAETLGSAGAMLEIDSDKFTAVGVEINANHIRSATNGIVTGYAEAVHLGRSSHVWQINIKDENQRLVCTSRLTLSIIPRRDDR